MNPDLDRAISDIQKGDIRQALSILVDFLKRNPTNEDGWSCLYSCLEKKDDKVYCLEKILKLNPENHHAAYELRMLSTSNYKSVDFSLVKSGSSFSAETNGKKIYPSDEKLKQKQDRKPKPAIKKQEQKQERKAKVVIEKPKRNSERKIKPAIEEEITEQTVDDTHAVKPPHVFDPNNYHNIRSKPGDNQFAKKEKNSGLIDTDAIMFGSRLIIGGISITPDDFPKCIEMGRTLPLSQCMICDFFSAVDCPLRHDPFLVHEAYILYAQRKRYIQEHKLEGERRRTSVLRAIYFELKEHGRPLHYEIIGRIISNRYPQLRLNSHKILHYMMRHPERFEWVDEGVYRAR